MSVLKKQAMASAAARSMNAPQTAQVPHDTARDSDQLMRDGTGGDDPSKKNGDGTEPFQGSGSPAIPSSQPSSDAVPTQTKQPWDYVDEILGIMKTGHPLLVLTIETMVDQVLQRFKASGEEEIYRLICMLLGDAVQACCDRISFNP